MLTTSPIVASSANASPNSFHYAPTRSSPHSSPARLSAPLPRRHSASRSSPSAASMTSPSSQPRPRQYVAVDAGTQYSPMESSTQKAQDATTPRTSTTVPATPVEPPPTPRPQPIDPSAPQPQPEPHQRSQPEIKSQPQPVVAPVIREASTTTASPGKRRNSQDPAVAQAQASASAAGESSSSAAKRPKPTAGPPKILPQRYELCSTEDMVVLISHMLSELIETNDALALRSGSLTRFHSRTAPSISVLEYLNRLAKHATLTPPLLLSMVYYIDRLCALYPEFTINTLTVHRFLITAATVAAKGLSDLFWNNTTYARVGGVRVAELKLLELEFLYRVDWKIVPNPEVLVAYYRGLVERCPGFALQDEEAEAIDEDEDSDEVEDDGSTEISDGGADDSGDSPDEESPAKSPHGDEAGSLQPS
ncbi:cyclin-domain-containing protein [Colletotrichum godetiae]|uniref:Cyclin-domain-containing protein n=1 Tax=Colletotrichum godetiae TaxID=1209918 RepID=A0AAJ0EVB2_9PEZI|nr:cyclin-domain-containing protein [Colletotrichum godetiae]KAK1688569.1 cyclin-domain-containing protein [Colletotrichum godetiae]